jgi:SET domain-containing protein
VSARPAAATRRQSRPMQISKRTGAVAQLEGVEVRRSEIHGQGVFALRGWRVGEEIGLYAGRRYGPNESPVGWDDQLTYLFGLSDGSVIDGAQGGNATRHINHACIPNVEAVERFADDGDLELVIRAVRRIGAGEELFLDYALVIDGDDAADYPCACGAGACRGTMAASAAETGVAGLSRTT